MDKEKMTEEEKSLVALFKQVEGEKARSDLLFHIEGMVRAQEALKIDFGLAGQDAPFFNSAGI
jgi:hypothetical protein